MDQHVLFAYHAPFDIKLEELEADRSSLVERMETALGS
jgi:hypothetical protein